MSKNINIYDILRNGDHKSIKENLLGEIYKMATYCSDIVGEGYFGKVSIPSVGPYISVKIDDMYYTIPVVIKETKNIGNIYMDEVGKDLIINSNHGITCEAIILYMISKLWYKGANPHLPFMIGMGSCDFNKQNLVTHIILERHGFDNRIEINFSNFVPTPNHLNWGESKFSRLTTVYELIQYINIHIDQNLKCKLPNNIEVYVPDIIDNFCIFYLHSSYYLWENLGIVLSDQHLNNLYVHWISELSRCGKRSVKNLENIYYDIGNNKFLKTKTHGIIFKIGDVGCSIMNIQKNVIVVGDLAMAEKLEKIKMYKTYHNFYLPTIEFVLNNFSREIKNKTKIIKLLDSNDNLSKYVPYVGMTNEVDKKTITELEVLNDPIFDNMKQINYVDDEENYVIHLKSEL